MKLYKGELSIQDKIMASFDGANGLYKTSCEGLLLIDDQIDAKEMLDTIKPDFTKANDEDAYLALSDDVTPLSSILVSDIWNRNGDVFTASELIAAFKTAQYKCINWMHNGCEAKGKNENIGVMIKSSLIKGDLDSLEAFDESDLEAYNKFACSSKVHIRQDGLIWSSYFPSYNASIQKGIEDGKLFVSVETFFRDFSYAIRAEDNDLSEIKFVARNENTSYLTKALTIFGGSGTAQYNGKNYNIGRVIHGMTISGQGIVDRPANAHNGKRLSIIFSSEKSKKENSEENLENGYNSIANNKEANSIMDKDQEISNLKAQIETITKERDKAISQVGQLQESALKDENDKLKSENETKANEISKLKEKLTETEKKIESVDSLTKERDDFKTKFETAQASLDKIETEKQAQARLKELVEIAGDKYSDKDLDKVKSWSDETFAAVKESLVQAGVSSERKATDDTISSQKKATDDTVSGEKKATEGSEKENKSADEAAEAVEKAEVNKDETSDNLVNAGEDDSFKNAKSLVSLAMAGNRK